MHKKKELRPLYLLYFGVIGMFLCGKILASWLVYDNIWMFILMIYLFTLSLLSLSFFFYHCCLEFYHAYKAGCFHAHKKVQTTHNKSKP